MGNDKQVFGVIGLLGRKGSGKSTVARYLAARYGAEVVSFANVLRNMGHVFMTKFIEEQARRGNDVILVSNIGETPVWHPYDREAFTDLARKEAVVTIRSLHGDDDSQYAELFSLRWLLMIVGTEMVRDNLGEDTWTDAAFDYMEKRADEGQRLFVVDDVRFQNELLTIRCQPYNGVIVKLTCSDDPVPEGVGHASEDIDKINLKYIDEAIVSHRSAGSDHLIGEFRAALERMMSSTEPNGRYDRVRTFLGGIAV